MKRIICIGLTTLLLSSSISGFANSGNNETVVGQFLTISNTPSNAERDPLQETFQVCFPVSVISVEDAMNYLLRGSGYLLVVNPQDYPWAARMMKAPLPFIQRHLGPMTLEAGLEVLAGNHFQIIEDRVNRLITFRVKPTLDDTYDPLINIQNHNNPTQH